MRIHERERVVQEAHAKVSTIMADLTPGEQLRVLSGELGMVAKYMIRVERHGDTGTPGGIAPDEGRVRG